MRESPPQLFRMLAGLVLATRLVGSAMLGTAAWVKIKNSQFLTVSGSALENIDSDLAVSRHKTITAVAAATFQLK